MPLLSGLFSSATSLLGSFGLGSGGGWLSSILGGGGGRRGGGLGTFGWPGSGDTYDDSYPPSYGYGNANPYLTQNSAPYSDYVSLNDHSDNGIQGFRYLDTGGDDNRTRYDHNGRLTRSSLALVDFTRDGEHYNTAVDLPHNFMRDGLSGGFGDQDERILNDQLEHQLRRGDRHVHRGYGLDGNQYGEAGYQQGELGGALDFERALAAGGGFGGGFSPLDRMDPISGVAERYGPQGVTGFPISNTGGDGLGDLFSGALDAPCDHGHRHGNGKNRRR